MASESPHATPPAVPDDPQVPQCSGRRQQLPQVPPRMGLGAALAMAAREQQQQQQQCGSPQAGASDSDADAGVHPAAMPSHGPAMGRHAAAPVPPQTQQMGLGAYLAMHASVPAAQEVSTWSSSSAEEAPPVGGSARWSSSSSSDRDDDYTPTPLSKKLPPRATSYAAAAGQAQKQGKAAGAKRLGSAAAAAPRPKSTSKKRKTLDTSAAKVLPSDIAGPSAPRAAGRGGWQATHPAPSCNAGGRAAEPRRGGAPKSKQQSAGARARTSSPALAAQAAGVKAAPRAAAARNAVPRAPCKQSKRQQAPQQQQQQHQVPVSSRAASLGDYHSPAVTGLGSKSSSASLNMRTRVTPTDGASKPGLVGALPAVMAGSGCRLGDHASPEDVTSRDADRILQADALAGRHSAPVRSFLNIGLLSGEADCWQGPPLAWQKNSHP